MSRSNRVKEKEYIPLWRQREMEYTRKYQENEKKMKEYNKDNDRNIDMGGGSRESESESSWYVMDT